MIDQLVLAHRRHLTAATVAYLTQAEVAGADKAAIKRALMALGPADACLLLPEEVEGLMAQLKLAEA